MGNFTHLKLCLAATIHNFKWVKLFRFYKMEEDYFQILLINVNTLRVTCLKSDI